MHKIVKTNAHIVKKHADIKVLRNLLLSNTNTRKHRRLVLIITCIPCFFHKQLKKVSTVNPHTKGLLWSPKKFLQKYILTFFE